MTNFYQTTIVKDERFKATGRISDLMMLEPVTRAAVQAILAEHPGLMVFETYRSQTRQRQLYEQGATQLAMVGVHGYGLACDIIKNVHGQPSWAGDFTFLGPLAKKHGLIWGGDWGHPEVHHGFRDMDHVQRVAVKDQNKLFSGSWYPDEHYNPYTA